MKNKFNIGDLVRENIIYFEDGDDIGLVVKTELTKEEKTIYTVQWFRMNKIERHYGWELEKYEK